MDVEIIEFYPYFKEGEKFAGSLHVYIIDLKMDLRGIHVSFDPTRDKKWIFRLTSKKAIDKESKLVVTYPVIQFSDKRKTLLLLQQIRYRGKPYIQKNFLGLEVTEPPKKERKHYENKPFKKPNAGPVWKKRMDGPNQGYQDYKSSSRSYGPRRERTI